MVRIESKRGMFALMMAHCAGMVDLVALPIWVGTLIAHYHFDPQQAGGLATLFLIGAAGASLFFAPRFNRIQVKLAAVLGFALATVAFVLSASTISFPVLAGLHFLGGLSAGTALSVTHGTMGHGLNPHRIFGIAGLAIGIFGVLFLGGTPGIIQQFGGHSMFYVMAGVMLLATLACLFFFPKPTRAVEFDNFEQIKNLPPLGKPVWFCMIGVALLAMTQAMTLSFYERIGLERGFSRDMVTMALVIYGIVTIFPAPLAALLEKRVSITAIIAFGPIFQGIFALLTTHTHEYAVFALTGPMMAFTILFVHTFAFGLLARLDPTGRAVAGTPAMLMVGAAVAPFISGTIVKFISFEAIGYACCVVVAVQVLLFSQTRKAVLTGKTSIPVQTTLKNNNTQPAA
ncbi:MFS transporter [Acinetobacter sp. ANC 4173]|uniref:MFS transporter n=1 Tax=Acinetobacter sp. ANC 4173 TaxID=2529837 RepID=UPI001039B910|nr:MFS transporter [Acinetobacter sp. ANC 4173]TCB82360.1 MFS transporter [Acinetobacter sp. ANC 4173]